MLWIAFKLVSLPYRKQRIVRKWQQRSVVNSFQISIFAISETTFRMWHILISSLWIAFKLVSLPYRKQRLRGDKAWFPVVNSFQISIFAISETTFCRESSSVSSLWIAFKLVSLPYRKQPDFLWKLKSVVVNSFQISIFAISETTSGKKEVIATCCE